MDRFQFIESVFVYYVTFTVVDWLPIFIKPDAIDVVNQSLLYCIETKGLKNHGYVIMPNHMHAIVSDKDYENIRLHSTLSEFRTFTGNRLAKLIDNHYPASWSQIIRNTAESDRARRFWQSGWHAEAVATREFFEQKLNYIHHNPVRAGLVDLPEYWMHSSACYWLLNEPCPVLISDFIV